MNSHLTFDDISLTYSASRSEDTEVFKQLGFEIGRGEFVSMIGPSGCGKTSLLKIICGLLEPTAGFVSIDGLDTNTAKQKRLFSYVFQNPVLLKWRTVRQNIILPAEISHYATTQKQVDDLIRLVGLSGFEDAYPDMLSGGMLSRVQIARALLLNPEGLALDECFGSLDEITRTIMNMELLRIWSVSHPTVVFVTHSVEEAVFLSDRILVFGQRPHGIEVVINVDLPRPREISIMDSQEFREILHKVRSALTSSYFKKRENSDMNTEVYFSENPYQTDLHNLNSKRL
jgi:NitT/TauT family transport system ATP-binding protein